MNLKVWKWTVRTSSDVQRIAMPRGTRLLGAGAQGSAVCIWGLVDPAGSEIVIRRIRIAGTGHPLGDDVDPGTAYVGRAEFLEGALQIHVFDLGPEEPAG